MKKFIIKKEDLINNINIIKKIAEENKTNDEGVPYKIIGVVKGNGLGIGIVELSKLLVENGINTLAVATVEEALQLRQAEINAEILMLSSTTLEDEIEQLIENNIILTIGSELARKNGK